jgi:transcriptional regulator with XRE-family HTH domain
MKKLNQTQISERLGISKSYLSMMLSGQRQIPDHLRSELCELNQLQFKPSKQAVAGSSPVSRSNSIMFLFSSQVFTNRGLNTKAPGIFQPDALSYASYFGSFIAVPSTSGQGRLLNRHPPY